MDKKEAVNIALKAIAKYYKQDYEQIKSIYLINHSIDYVLFRLDKQIKRGFNAIPPEKIKAP